MERKIKTKLVLKKRIKKLLTKSLLTIIILLIGLISIKQNPNLKTIIKENLYEKSFHFTPTKKIYEKYFGNILSIDKIKKDTSPVFNEKLTYSKIEKYEQGVKLAVTNNYLVPAIESGVVVFIGEKEKYGSTIIIEQVDGVNTLYANVKIDNIILYDYIEKGELLGEVHNNKLYLVFQKNGKYLNYQEYI